MQEQNQHNEEGAQDTSRRDVLKSLGKAAYIAPVTLAILASDKAAAY